MSKASFNLGDRMQEYYESQTKFFLIKKVPVIIRIDGKCFHNFTKQFKQPFDEDFSNIMINTTISLCKKIQGVKLGYVQSDEISLLLSDLDKIESKGWFDYKIQKMTSISASFATSEFNKNYLDYCNKNNVEVKGFANFDSRVFNIPNFEVENYFIWRQNDWLRNSVFMLANSYYSHKELKYKNRDDMHEMIYKKGDNWAKLPDKWKNGTTITKNETKWHISGKSIFNNEETRKYIRNLINVMD